MTAREKFRKGDRVMFSDKWIERNNFKSHKAIQKLKSQVSTVVGFGIEDKLSVWILRDGHVSTDRYHIDFLEKIS